MVDLIIAILLNLRFEIPTPITESDFCSMVVVAPLCTSHFSPKHLHNFRAVGSPYCQRG